MFVNPEPDLVSNLCWSGAQSGTYLSVACPDAAPSGDAAPTEAARPRRQPPCDSRLRVGRSGLVRSVSGPSRFKRGDSRAPYHGPGSAQDRPQIGPRSDPDPDQTAPDRLNIGTRPAQDRPKLQVGPWSADRRPPMDLSRAPIYTRTFFKTPLLPMRIRDPNPPNAPFGGGSTSRNVASETRSPGPPGEHVPVHKGNHIWRSEKNSGSARGRGNSASKISSR